MVPFALILLLSSCLSSCSTLITKEDCKKNMRILGIEHGKRGYSNLSEDIRKNCTTTTEFLNLEAYQDGFKMGWSDHCTAFQGYEMGRKGDLYKSFCPSEKEDLFHEKFLIGKKVYEKNDQITDLEEKIKDLSQAIEKDNTSISTKDELKKNQDELLSLKRDIQRLEQKGKNLGHTN